MKSVPLPSRIYVLFCVMIFGSRVSESAVALTMINNCKETIWPGVSPGQSFDGGGFELKPKEAREFTAPANWTGRVWGRTGCKFDLQGQGKCETGSCGDSLKCTAYGNPPATLAEFSFGLFQGLDFYDVSLVDGFNVPLAITPINPKGSCAVTGCREDLTTTCPPELALKVNGNTVACQSACHAFNTSQYCCTGTFFSPQTCVQTTYSNIFKEACPAAYTTAMDDNGTTFTCSGADYAITFCSSRLDLYNTVPTPLPAPTRPPNVAIPPAKFSESRRRRNSLPTVMIVVIISIIFAVLFVAVSIFLFLKRKPKGLAEEAGDDIMTVESLRFDFATIRAATNDFSDDNKLGQGGFGVVYKGRLSNGEAIAVKRLSKESTQGELEFKNEVLLLARLEHKNLVRLLGFSLERHERLLVYELIKNSSLDKYLFDPTIGRILDWEKRYNIITGIARGLLYLHEDSRLRIIHRDLKASNILLDDRMNPKIADFGLARLFAEDQTQQDTNRIVGTFGYMPPEYVGRGQFSMKSDVFSFGVLVLEIISGQKISTFRNEEGDSLLTYAWKNWNESRATNLIDYRLRDCWSSEMMRCIHMGLLCVQENAKDRPNMASIVQMLGNQSITRRAPSKPAFSSNNTIQPDCDNRNHSAPSSSSVNTVSISELCPR